MNNLPYDIELIIYKYIHELNLYTVLNQLKKEYNDYNMINNFVKKRVPYHYRICFRYRKDMNFFIIKIFKHIHYKKFYKCLYHIIKPIHLYF